MQPSAVPSAWVKVIWVAVSGVPDAVSALSVIAVVACSEWKAACAAVAL